MTKPVLPIGIFGQPASSFAKWKSRGINTLYGYDNGGNIAKAAWESAAEALGMFYVSPAGTDPASEAKQVGRLGFMQPDEPDLITHINLAGSKITDLQATYTKLKPFGVPVWQNLAGNCFDNVAYDGTPHSTKTDASKWGHRAATGGYMAWADIIGFDYYLWTTGRAGMFDIIQRLMDRCHDWSGGKPQFVTMELCTQGSGLAYTADNFQSQVDNIVNYAAKMNYKLAAIVGFADVTIPNWTSYDGIGPDVAARMPVTFAKLNPSPAPIPAPLPAPAPAPSPVHSVTIDGVIYVPQAGKMV